MSKHTPVIDALKDIFESGAVVVSPMTMMEVIGVCLLLKKMSLEESTEASLFPPEAHPDQLSQLGERLTARKFRTAVQDILTNLEAANPERLPSGVLTGIFKKKKILDIRFFKEVLMSITDHVPIGESPEFAGDVMSSLMEHLSGAMRYRKFERISGDGFDIDSPYGLDRLAARLVVEGFHVPADRPVTLCDPVCGTGGFLVETAREIGFHRCRVSGMEKDPTIHNLARINLLLHDLDPRDVLLCDTLLEPGLVHNDQLRQWDLIVAGIPVIGRLLPSEIPSDDRFLRFTSGIPRRPEYLFLSHIIKSMEPANGRALVIIPPNALFVGDHPRGVENQIRRDLVETNLLDAVIMLPRNITFSSVTPLAALVLDRSREDGGANDSRKNVVFIDAGGESFYQRGRLYHVLLPRHVDEICRLYRSRISESGIVRCVERDEIRANHYNLSIPRYVTEAPRSPPLSELKVSMDRTEQELLSVQSQIRTLLQTLQAESGSAGGADGTSPARKENKS